jgi:glutamate racemase
MYSEPIGVFDSGVGGLTVFKALAQAVPRKPLIYLGDTARVPYGTKSAATVVRYALEAARFLDQYRIKMLVVACNTASALALDALREAVRVPVVDVIGPGARRAVRLTRTGRIGVIGTRATVESQAYPRAIHALEPRAEVASGSCPLFVPLAEEGWTDNEVAFQVARAYLEPFRQARVDTLVLGCTHYPLLRATIARVMGHGVQLVDSAESVAAEIRDRLGGGTEGGAEPARAPAVAPRAGPADGLHHFFVTDVPGPFQAVAERFLGRPIPRLERVRIEG